VSQENVEFLRNLFAASESLDKDALVAMLPDMIPEICDPEIEWIEDPTRADGRTYRGHDGVRESWERWLEDFDTYAIEIESITDHGDRAAVTAVEHGRGSASGAEVSSRVHTVVTFRAGKILRYEEFYDEQDALAALERQARGS
jgi:ketosteroid isomerase-like protein